MRIAACRLGTVALSTAARRAVAADATHVNVLECMTTSARTLRMLTDHLGLPRLAVDSGSGPAVQPAAFDDGRSQERGFAR